MQKHANMVLVGGALATERVLPVPLMIATESCESLNECGARWRIAGRAWNSLVVVTRSHVENSHKLFLSILDPQNPWLLRASRLVTRLLTSRTPRNGRCVASIATADERFDESERCTRSSVARTHKVLQNCLDHDNVEPCTSSDEKDAC